MDPDGHDRCAASPACGGRCRWRWSVRRPRKSWRGRSCCRSSCPGRGHLLQPVVLDRRGVPRARGPRAQDPAARLVARDWSIILIAYVPFGIYNSGSAIRYASCFLLFLVFPSMLLSAASASRAGRRGSDEATQSAWRSRDGRHGPHQPTRSVERLGKDPMKFVLFANTDWYLYNFRLSTALELKARGHEVVMLSPPGEFGGRFAAHGLRWRSRLRMDRASLNPLREAIDVARGRARVLKEERARPAAQLHGEVRRLRRACRAAGEGARRGQRRRRNGVRIHQRHASRRRTLRPIVKLP